MNTTTILATLLILITAGAVQAQTGAENIAISEAGTNTTDTTAYDFGDSKASTLVNKAWSALKEKEPGKALSEQSLNAVLAYTNRCISYYSERALKMQADLTELPVGNEKTISSFWPLNTVAKSLFIQGEAYRLAGKHTEAKKAFLQLIAEFPYGQMYNKKTQSFQVVADLAKKRLKLIN